MEELYSIMRDFLEVEYNQESLICLLKAAEAAYSGENQIKAKLLPIVQNTIYKPCRRN